MDETPVFFDIVPEKLLVPRGKKLVTIRTSASHKRHFTDVLAVAANRSILQSMMIF